MIEEIKSWNKDEMFKAPEKKKIGIFNRILIIFGYGKKG